MGEPVYLSDQEVWASYCVQTHYLCPPPNALLTYFHHVTVE